MMRDQWPVRGGGGDLTSLVATACILFTYYDPYSYEG